MVAVRGVQFDGQDVGPDQGEAASLAGGEAASLAGQWTSVTRPADERSIRTWLAESPRVADVQRRRYGTTSMLHRGRDYGIDVSSWSPLRGRSGLSGGAGVAGAASVTGERAGGPGGGQRDPGTGAQGRGAVRPG